MTPVGTSLGHESINPHIEEHIAPLMLTIVMFSSSAEHLPCPRAVVFSARACPPYISPTSRTRFDEKEQGWSQLLRAVPSRRDANADSTRSSPDALTRPATSLTKRSIAVRARVCSRHRRVPLEISGLPTLLTCRVWVFIVSSIGCLKVGDIACAHT